MSKLTYKMNWNVFFLEFLKLSSREDILFALEPYYDGFSARKVKITELDNEYKEAVKLVPHLENRSCLTLEEHNEWEGTIGWYEHMWEENAFKEDSLATGLIIALWKLANHYALAVAKGLSNKGSNGNITKYDLFMMGPKVKGQPWAKSINAASNYLRHADDWSKFYKDIRDRKSFDEAGSNNSDKISLMNIKILTDLGIDVDLLLLTNDMSYRIAEKLEILKWSRMRELYSEWLGYVGKFAKDHLPDENNS
jgi:hypothetical protein